MTLQELATSSPERLQHLAREKLVGVAQQIIVAMKPSSGENLGAEERLGRQDTLRRGLRHAHDRLFVAGLIPHKGYGPYYREAEQRLAKE